MEDRRQHSRFPVRHQRIPGKGGPGGSRRYQRALLAWGAYQGGASAQSSNAVLAIKAMYLYIPMLLLICSIVTMMFYNLDKIYPQIKAVLDSRNE